MYLKSLALRGFKSFASATTLNFEPGITAIVGPNGSGKSNIVDALAWVMGEQGAKHLRGAKMEDVIFAGTAGRAPLGRAEVTLTIDNTDGALPIEYTEVTLTRTLFRSGSSEYAINGQTARLLDVQELLSDTGMGREMHVIVGQGQLEQILASNPEMRRGYIEEAAGVLKHRRRREKAVRKLESTGTNLDRLTDLIAEIRRQLKPLGRQAAVARKAGIVQAELRDARARLLADDLTTATLALESDRQAAEQAERIRAQAQARLEAAQREEQRAEQALAEVTPALSAAQQHLLSASTLGERNQTTTTLSAERMRRSGAQPARTPGRDPQELEAQAARAREDEAALRAGLAEAKSELSQAGEARQQAEHAHVAAEAEYGQQLRALADHREGLARLNGQLSSLQSRLDAGREENARLAHRRDEALHRAEEADREYLSLESSITGLGEGESQLDADYEQAGSAVHSAEQQLEELDTQQVEVDREVSSLRARLEALRLGLQRDDGAAALLDTEVEGITSALSGELGVQPGWEAALAAALGRSADAVVARDPQTAREGLDRLRDAELGRARIIIARGQGRPSTLGSLPDGAHRLVDLVTAGPELSGTLEGLLGTVVAVPDLSMAAALLDTQPELVVVTSGGELVSSWFAEGGSGQARSTIELQAEVTRSSEELHAAEKRSQQLRFARQTAGRAVAEAIAAADACLERLNESDASMSALAEQISHLGQVARAARAEATRLDEAMAKAAERRCHDEQQQEVVRARLENAGDKDELIEPDPTLRDGTAVSAGRCRQAETDAQLAVRTAEERLKPLDGRADSLLRAAARERAARAQAAARTERLRREQAIARCVYTAAQWLGDQIAIARRDADAEKQQAEQARIEADTAVATVRRESREAAARVEELVRSAHQDDMVHIEQQVRIEALAEKAMNELGLEAQPLMDEYGPDKLVPVLSHPDGTAFDDDEERPGPIAFDRAQQTKRLKSAQRTLTQLGRINPLALEEFDALNQRHQFLAEQLADLQHTRKDLQSIIDEVDARVQQVFTQAYADVERTFAEIFPRLFPGGDGRLVLTDPDDLLATGVDIEARPAGKKVKRMSLLSGGERSLVSVAFLFSLFIARPSPFYILDEVEAALDDMNLSRLLGIYEELRKDSQLLVITHQKRTMEKADALYGVTMRGDGVTTVISQRLAD